MGDPDRSSRCEGLRHSTRQRTRLLLAALLVPAAAQAGASSTSIWDGDGNQAHANYGYSVNTAGDVNGDGFSDLLVGARSYDAGQINEGRAYVYLGSPSGPATTAAWTAESDQLLAFYGASVAPAGDVNGDGYGDVLVGAPSFDGALSNEGRAFLYLGSSAGLAAAPAWTHDGGQISCTFGNAVATAGDVNGDGYDDIIIGVRGWDGAESNGGRAMVFHGGPAGPDSIPDWTIDGDQDNAAYGWSVATAGDVNGDGYADVIVGAFFQDEGLTDEGAAWVYLGSASGLATTPCWQGEGNQADASFGWSVAPAGDVNGDGYADVVVGARYHDAAVLDGGRAYVFLGNAAGVDSAAVWSVDGTQTDAFLGWSVSTAGDVNGDGLADVLVGAYRQDAQWIDDGQAAIYLGNSTGVDSAAVWTASSLQQGANFGWSVAAAGDVDGDGFGDVVVGSYFHDDGQENEGRASVFRGSSEGPSPTSWWKGAAGGTTTNYGFAVDYAGDVNGDGFTDLLVSDPLADLGGGSEGRVDLYLGSEFGPDSSPGWSTGGTQSGENWGRSVSGRGDVNGDGFDDVLVGSPFHTGLFNQEGRASLFLGSAIGLSSLFSWDALGGSLSAELGAAVAFVGDINGDGFADLAVGAPDLDGAIASSGVVWVFYGSASGPAASPDVVLEGFFTGGRFGESLAGVGDVNADGFADLVVGEPAAANGEVGEGRIHLYLGAAIGLATSPIWSAEGDQAGARLGHAVAAAGDMNGDGFSDIAAVAPLWDGGELEEGHVVVYLGGASGPPSTSPDWSWEPDQGGAQLDGVQSGGDVNADGFGDLLVGSSHYVQSFLLEGRALLFLGSVSGPESTFEQEWLGERAFARMGSSMTGRGDPDGNGWPDLLIGARGWSDSTTSGGAVFLMAANRAGAGAVGLQQRREDDAAPISLGGRSDSETGFRLQAWGGSAGGRTRVTLEWEVKEVGFPFDGNGTDQTSEEDSGAPQPGLGSRVPLVGIVTGLTPGTAYAWRLRTRSRSPFFPSSPWFTPTGNGRTEMDVRTWLEPAVGVRSVSPRSAGLSARPSPFRESTTVALSARQSGPASLVVYDVAGRLVAELHTGWMPAGEQRFRWDGRDRSGRAVAPGVYWVRWASGREAFAIPVIRLR